MSEPSCGTQAYVLETPLTLIHVFFKIKHTCWCLCLTHIWHKQVQLMEGKERPQMNKCKEITNDWNYDTS
jgi:hypothetical protein